MIRAVVFDLWNTLVFSPVGSPFARMKELLREDQVGQFPALMRDGMAQPYASVEAFLEAWRAPLGLEADQLEAMVAAFEEAGAHAQCFQGASDAVASVRDLARVALLSNTQTFGLELLGRLGIEDRIRTRLLSAELGTLKPETAAFEAAQRTLGLFPGNLVMVGDSWTDDVEGALAAGWTAVWVNRAGAPRPDHDPDAQLYEVRTLDVLPGLVRDLQAGMRCPTCLG